MTARIFRRRGAGFGIMLNHWFQDRWELSVQFLWWELAIWRKE